MNGRFTGKNFSASSTFKFTIDCAKTDRCWTSFFNVNRICQKKWMNSSSIEMFTYFSLNDLTIWMTSQVLVYDTFEFVKPVWVWTQCCSIRVRLTSVNISNEMNELSDMWLQAKESDKVLQELTYIVIEWWPHFPTHLELWVSILKCTVNNQNELLFCNQHWVTNLKPLHLRII